MKKILIIFALTLAFWAQTCALAHAVVHNFSDHEKSAPVHECKLCSSVHQLGSMDVAPSVEPLAVHVYRDVAEIEKSAVIYFNIPFSYHSRAPPVSL